MAIKNMAASVLTRLKNQSKEEGIPFQMVLHRNKVDGEVFNVAIQRYVQDPKKVEARLMKYAKLLHVEKKVREILGVWL